MNLPRMAMNLPTHRSLVFPYWIFPTRLRSKLDNGDAWHAAWTQLMCTRRASLWMDHSTLLGTHLDRLSHPSVAPFRACDRPVVVTALHRRPLCPHDAVVSHVVSLTHSVSSAQPRIIRRPRG